MLKRFYPDDYVDSAYEIPYEELYKKGYRGIVFDVDNTLVEHGAPVTERAVALFERLRKTGYDTCIISNNKEPRVRPLAEAVHSKYVSDAKKPSPKNYIKAMECMKTDVNTTFFVGDQLFTDVWGCLLYTSTINGMRGCHLTLNKQDTFLIVSGYHDGKITVLHINEDGSVGKIADEVFHKGIGSVAERNFRPHVSSSVFTPDEELLCCLLYTSGTHNTGCQFFPVVRFSVVIFFYHY